jgi:hypothetical protein
MSATAGSRHKTVTSTLDLYRHLFDDDLDSVADGMEAAARAAAGWACGDPDVNPAEDHESYI